MVQNTLKDQILQLRSENKSYQEIKTILGCSKGTISYYLGKGQKDKTLNRQKQYRKINIKYILIQKILMFSNKTYIIKKNNIFQRKINRTLQIKLYDFQRKNKTMNEITLDQILNKFGDNPKCYLTGRPIDLTKSREYHFDHIVPISKGGKNTLDNLGLTCKDVNFAKRDLLVEDFIKLCKDVLVNQGYIVEKN